jgi:hypothetical protein
MNESLRSWLDNYGDSLLRWDRGMVVIESYYEKEFRALGGDILKLAACFEDNGEMNGAVEDYFKN